MKWLVCGLVSLLLVLPAYGQVLTGPGQHLDVLQKIQGRWKSDCHPVEAGPRYGYQRINLIVTFTHFKFSIDEYPAADCMVKRSTSDSHFRYVLRGPVFARDGTPAFAVDFAVEAEKAGHMKLYPFNILNYKAGVLRLGEPPVVETTDRLQELDPNLQFTRR